MDKKILQAALLCVSTGAFASVPNKSTGGHGDLRREIQRIAQVHIKRGFRYKSSDGKILTAREVAEDNSPFLISPLIGREGNRFRLQTLASTVSDDRVSDFIYRIYDDRSNKLILEKKVIAIEAAGPGLRNEIVEAMAHQWALRLDERAQLDELLKPLF